jgi:hypothetical protein
MDSEVVFPGKCVTGRGTLDSEQERSPQKSALRDVAPWIQSKNVYPKKVRYGTWHPGLRARTFTPKKCVTGRVLLDSESESRAFHLFARAWTQIWRLDPRHTPPPRRRFFRPAVGPSTHPTPTAPIFPAGGTRPLSGVGECVHVFYAGSVRRRKSSTILEFKTQSRRSPPPTPQPHQ